MKRPSPRDDRRCCQIPAAGEVVVEEGLEGHDVHVLAAPARVGPDVVHERSGHDVLAHVEADQGRPEAPFSAAKLRTARGGEKKRRTDAPDEFPRLARREERGERRVADAGHVGVRAWGRPALDGQDGARDDVPVLVDRDGNHRLDVERVVASLG